MWEVVNGESDDLLWLAEALCQGTSIWTTDGSYDRKRAPRVSGAGWIICDKATRKVLRGNFYEVSRSASSYRGELLGLLALHTLALAVVEFYGIEQATGVMRCDNDPALIKSKSNRRRVRSGASQADILRALRSIKTNPALQFTYEWVPSHQDKHKAWHLLPLAAQLNVRCNELAKEAVLRSLIDDRRLGRALQLLPREKAAIFVEGRKLTEEISDEVRFVLGEAEARCFYTRAKKKKGLGWSSQRFDQVDFRARGAALAGKPDAYGIWLCKQQSGTCATRKNMARIQDLINDRCPNCLQRGEDAGHLNRCPDEGRQQLFREGVERLSRWMNEDNRTDPEVAYWFPKYLLLQGSVRMADLGPMSPAFEKAARSQNMIGWRETTEGMLLKDFWQLQTAHCSLLSCVVTGDDWCNHFVF